VAPPDVLKIGMLMLGVTDMRRAVAFYREAVGLPVQFGSDEFTFLDGGFVTLVLQARKELPPPDDGLRTEVVFTVDDIDAAHRALRERGVAFRIEPRIVAGDRLAADFRDPDGHVLSIFGPRKG
jgi:catechol 2,3-dioxygenase-like lactoylglutathione lyase family enzyme